MNSSYKTNFLIFFETEKTSIVVKPQDKTVKEGDNVDLQCRATYDVTLEIRYFWKRDDATIVYDSKIRWDDSKNVLIISDISVEDAGVYTCVAYTPEPKRSEDTASAIINIQGIVETLYLQGRNTPNCYMLLKLGEALSDRLQM